MKLWSRTIGSGTVADSWESRELPKLTVAETKAKLVEVGPTSSSIVAVLGSDINSRSWRTESLWVAVACFSHGYLGHIYFMMHTYMDTIA